MDMAAYYGQLVGFKIVGFHMEPDDYGDPFPTFTVEDEQGEKLSVSLSRDPEGNGGGFAFIAPEAGIEA